MIFDTKTFLMECVLFLSCIFYFMLILIIAYGVHCSVENQTHSAVQQKRSCPALMNTVRYHRFSPLL